MILLQSLAGIGLAYLGFNTLANISFPIPILSRFSGIDQVARGRNIFKSYNIFFSKPSDIWYQWWALIAGTGTLELWKEPSRARASNKKLGYPLVKKYLNKYLCYQATLQLSYCFIHCSYKVNNADYSYTQTSDYLLDRDWVNFEILNFGDLSSPQ